MKKRFLLLLIFFSTPLFAQDFLWNLKIGAANRSTSEGNYIVVDLKPFFYFKGFYGALDLDFSLEPSGALKQNDWDNAKAITQKIVYLGYGKERQDPYFFRIGTLDDVVLGFGILMDHYRNDVYYPLIKKQGFYGGLDLGHGGLTFVCDDIFDWDLFGGRVFGRPLYWMSPENAPSFVRFLQIGFSFLTDLDPLNKENNGAGKGYLTYDDPHSKAVKAYAIDLFMPVFESKNFTIDNYMQYGDILEIGAGLSYGFKGKILKNLSYRLDLSYNWGGFKPGYFSEFYNIRTVRMNQFNHVKNLENNWSYLIGFYGNFFDNQLSTGAEFFHRVNENPSFLLYLRLQPSLLKRFFLQFSYNRYNISSIVNLFDVQDLNTSLIHLEIGYEMTANASISLRYIQNYQENNGVVKGHSTTEIQTSLIF